MFLFTAGQHQAPKILELSTSHSVLWPKLKLLNVVAANSLVTRLTSRSPTPLRKIIFPSNMLEPAKLHLQIKELCVFEQFLSKYAAHKFLPKKSQKIFFFRKVDPISLKLVIDRSISNSNILTKFQLCIWSFWEVIIFSKPLYLEKFCFYDPLNFHDFFMVKWKLNYEKSLISFLWWMEKYFFIFHISVLK